VSEPQVSHLTSGAPVSGVPKAGVIIVNWNLAEDTLACLDSVFQMDYPACEVTVVDNGSTDGSVARIEAVFPQVCQIVNGENRGFAAAANQGIEYALARGCDYVLVLNNDTTVAPDLLAHLVAAGEADPMIGILSPRILYFDQPEHTWHLAARWHRWLPMPVDVAPSGGDVVDADFVSGCAMMLRRRLLQEIGGFDTRYFMYGEDIDLCARARQAGYRVVAVPRARMWHKISVSAARISTDTRYWQTRNQILVYRRHPHGPLAGLLPVYVGLKAVLDVARDLARGQANLIGPLLRGMRDGLREPLL
jgi:GT2 family glycosyltransferase